MFRSSDRLLWLLVAGAVALVAGPAALSPASLSSGADAGGKEASAESETAEAEAASTPPNSAQAGCATTAARVLRDVSHAGACDPAAILAALSDLGYGEVRAMVATVPDPVDSPFAEAFDGYLAAIHSAVETAGYTADRFFDPWRSASQKDPRRPFRDQPGLVVFRRDRECPSAPGGPCQKPARQRSLLALLMVGETPTWGVQPGAFDKALDLAAALGTGWPARARLALLGPSSSGAAESIRTGIELWSQARKRDGKLGAVEIEMVSGSATSSANLDILETELSARLAKIFPATGAVHVTFAATVNPDDAQWAFVHDFLVKRFGAKNGEIALLTESSTDYGQGLKVTAKVDDAGSRALPLMLRFPLYVSQLRAEYDRRRARATTTPGDGSPRTMLDLPGREERLTEDALSLHSPLSRASIELSLSRLLETLASDRVRFVAILASDPLDVLFLVEQIRKSFPAVVVAVFSSDLLYLHESHPFMDGVLVASSYPLSPWSQSATFPFQGPTSRRIFATEYAQGTYNATIALLDDASSKDVLDYSHPFDFPKLGESLSPSLWLSVISRGTLWPVSVSRPAPGNYVQTFDLALEGSASPKKLHQDWQNSAWETMRSLADVRGLDLVAGILAAISLALALSFLLERNRTERPGAGRLPLSAVLRPSSTFPFPGMQRFEIAALFGVLLGLHGLVFWQLAGQAALRGGLGAFQRGLGLRIVLDAGFCAVSGLLVAVVVMAVEDWLTVALKFFRAVRGLAIIAGLVSIVVLLAMLIADHREFPLDERRLGHVLAFLRSSALFGGQSVIIFVLAVAACHVVWIVGHLRQVWLCESTRLLRDDGWLPRPTMPPARSRRMGLRSEPEQHAPDALSNALGLHGRTLVDVVASVENVWPASRAVWAAMVVVFTATAYALGDTPVFEAPLRGFIVLGCAPLFAFIVFGYTRFVRTWRQFREALLEMTIRPIAGAFERIPRARIEALSNRWQDAVQSAGAQAWTAAGGAPDGEHGPFRTGDPASVPMTALVSDDSARRIAAEDWATIGLCATVHYIRSQLYNCLGVLTLAMLPLIWLAGGYPFQGNRVFLALILALMAAVIATTVTIFIQMKREPILRALDRPAEGTDNVGWSTVGGILVHGALPLLTFLAIKFPSVGRWLLSSLGPLLKALSG